MTVSLEQEVDTVAVAVPDATGRLMGRRMTATRYRAVAAEGFAMPDFHLVTGLENVPHEGLDVAGPHTGFGNGLLRPDQPTLRLEPWATRTALVLCDVHTRSGDPVEQAPRWVLRRQLERLAARGLTARCATELEFYVFQGTPADLHRGDYRELRPSYHLQGDNDLLVAGHDEAFIAELRSLMPQAGIPLEVSHGEGGPGQHELTLAHTEPLEAADRHVVYKHGVKQIAARRDLAVTFMAKPLDDIPGSSGHVHLSLTHADGRPALGGENTLGEFGSAFVAGVLTHTPEFLLLHAPYANSYRRLAGSWAPSQMEWGYDDRTRAVRVLGSGPNLRIELRVPGADTNPYLSVAALLATGLEGVEQELALPDVPPDLPADLSEAVAAFAASEVAARVLGIEVRDHFANLGVRERDVTRAKVTDWDRRRGFERA